MRFWARLGLLFYMFTVIFISLGMAAFVLHLVGFQDVQDVLYVIYHDREFRVIFGAIAVVLLLKNHFYARAISGVQQKEKTIAFDNPSGRVSVSLSAMEDLIRRVVTRIPEVKEVRPFIVASGRGLEISARLILKAEVNIPEMTARLQELIKHKVQDTIGIEETIIVKIDVVKIIPEDHSAKQNKNKEDSRPPEPTVPFQGYRA